MAAGGSQKPMRVQRFGFWFGLGEKCDFLSHPYINLSACMIPGDPEWATTLSTNYLCILGIIMRGWFLRDEMEKYQAETWHAPGNKHGTSGGYGVRDGEGPLQTAWGLC